MKCSDMLELSVLNVWMIGRSVLNFSILLLMIYSWFF